MVHKFREAWKRAGAWAPHILSVALGVLFIALGIAGGSLSTGLIGAAAILLGALNLKISWNKSHFPTSGRKERSDHVDDETE